MPSHPKRRLLQQQGNLHRRPQAVTDPLFLQHSFFDPHDLVQVKYEMLRRTQSEGHSVTQAAAAFGSIATAAQTQTGALKATLADSQREATAMAVRRWRWKVFMVFSFAWLECAAVARD